MALGAGLLGREIEGFALGELVDHSRAWLLERGVERLGGADLGPWERALAGRTMLEQGQRRCLMGSEKPRDVALPRAGSRADVSRPELF